MSLAFSRLPTPLQNLGQRRIKTKTRSKQKNRRRDTRPDEQVC
jgi:hypothetical protein